VKSLFKTLFSLPRWITFPTVVGALVGLTAACYPGGLSAAYADVRDAHQLNARVDECKANEREMSDRLSTVKERMQYKEELVNALVRGQTTLAATSDQFAEAHRGDDAALRLMRQRYGDLPEPELAARTVLDYVRQRTAPDGGSSVAVSRIRAEFEHTFGHPAPRE
jgi:hypothetical protein